MPRQTPTENIDNLGGFDVSPFKDLLDYLESKDYEKKWFLRPPFFGIDTLETFFIHNKIDYDFVQGELKKLQEEQKKQNILSENRIRLVRNMHDELQTSFVRLNKFLRASDEERKAAFREINEQFKLQDKLELQIDIKRKEVNELTLFRDVFNKTIDEYKIYETVTNEAVARSNNKFRTSDEMIKYCDAILFSQEEINNLGDNIYEKIDRMKRRVVEIVKKAQLHTLGLQNQLHTMARNMEKNQQECLYWEKIYQEVNKTVISQRLKQGQIRGSVSQMYGLLCKRRRLYAHIPYGEVGRQIDFIRDEVELLQDVVNEYNKRKKVHILSTKPMSKC